MIIHLCPLSTLDAELRQRYRDTLLSGDERVRLGQFKRQQAADQFLTGRALLRATLGDLLGRDPQSLQIDRRDEGKPVIRDSDGWHFNLSHSRDWVALALSRDGEVGVDIESSDRRNDIDGIAERFFRPEEAAWLRSLSEAERRARFFQLWTVKEATVKALGRGIADTLIDTGVHIEGERVVVTLTGAIAREPQPLCWHTTLDDGRYHLAAAVLGGTPLQPIVRYTLPLRFKERTHE